MNAYAGGGEWDMPQQQIPQQQMLSECNPKQGYYRTLREYKELPWKQKADVTFQFIGNQWGYSWLVVIPLIIGAMFWRQVLDFIKNNKITIVKKQ